MTEKVEVNHDYKDALFKELFGNDDNKEYTLSLYNAINKTKYKDANSIKFVTIKDVLFISMKNDVGFLIGTSINLYEQQSTWNSNMPFRMFEYISKMLTNFVEDNYGKNAKYGLSPLRLPTPKCVVFYNGYKNIENDSDVLRLSNLFEKPSESSIECEAVLYNINDKRNKELLDSCKPLSDYASLIDEINENKKKYGLGEEATNKAVIDAISKVPKTSCLYPIIQKEGDKISNMLKTEFNEKEFANEFISIGYTDGKRDNSINTAKKCLRKDAIL